MAGEALLGAAFSVLLDRLTSPELVKFFRGQKHDERLLKKLKLKLLGLNKVLNDAEDKQITHRAVKEWLDELKDAVYHAEDLVDEIATEALRCKVEAENQSGPNQVQSLISSFTKLFDVEIESKLERMIDVLEDFTKEKDVLGLREVGGRNWSQTRLPTTSLVDESCVYGRENDKEEIMKLLEDGNPHGITEKVRYFSFVRSRFCSFEKFKEIREATCLSTFLPFKGRGDLIELSKKVVDEIVPRLTRLRLLSLSEYGIGELPYSIVNLIHLRFLDLSRAQIRELPESVCTLYNLETLLLFECDLLTTLPADLVKLISLRHLDLSGTNLKEMPLNISRLKDLQQLTVFVVGKCTGINELGEFHCLRGTISISGLENVESSNDALEAKMSEKKHLEKLALEWNSTIEDSQNARDVFEKLEPHTTLKHLEIKNYGGTRFPTWLGDQSFCNMVSLRLEKCENCFSLPPLCQMPSLKELTIARMPVITNVGHEFYGESGSLSKPFQSLETLRFEKMSGWVNWCILDAGEFSRLQKLEIIDCPKLIGHLPTNVPSLARLKIVDCPELVASLSSTTSISSLVLKQCQGVQSEWQSVSSVEKLEISGFESLKEFASELVTLTNLKELKVENSSLCVPISEEISHCSMFLERLTLDSCESLKSLQLGLFPKLQYLGIKDCKNFETLLIPDGIVLENVTLLERLSISNCNNMLSFPCGGLPAPNLSSLSLFRCEKLKALPGQMHTLLSSLQSLELSRCPEIESFPEGGLPSKLGHLKIWNCKKLVGCRREWGLQTLPSLTSFSLWGESEDVLESFPEDGLLPPTLTFLHFGDLQNLKSLNKRGLQLLGSLERMHFFACPQLQSFPVERLPTSLLELYVSGCPLLKPRCRRKEGEDWHKIAHIPFITIHDEGYVAATSVPANINVSLIWQRKKEVPKSLAFENFQSQSGRASLAIFTSLYEGNFAANSDSVEMLTHFIQDELCYSAGNPSDYSKPVKPFVHATPPVFRNVEQYQQLTLGSQLYPSTPIIKLDLLGSTVPGHGSNTALLSQPKFNQPARAQHSPDR
ncbi:hypothetical protein RHSIM_Rhsim07G0059900 [Rhododendron simsii]|uniref:Rx N-terminal domain-containing protein n=1 Tax=Rhododendron simsii TaxID=118357 RepID=A0A834GMZ3_RHOSS|nr:hypothetical protein RHSIM_Rhsim07G0059900 [Rhododendron simsii]